MNKNVRKFVVKFSPESAGMIKHLFPAIPLIVNRHDRDLAINLLGFSNQMDYIKALQSDKSYGEMLSVILFLFLLDEVEARKSFFSKITFFDKTLEKRLRNLCDIPDEGLSVAELEAMWAGEFPVDEWWDTNFE